MKYLPFPLVLLLSAISAGTLFAGGVTSVGAIDLTVGSLDRELAFYTTVLPFERVDTSDDRGVAVNTALALANAHTRTATLKLGSELIRLTEFVAPTGGRPIPADSRSYDAWFQHIAIVVRDMDAAYAILAKAKVKHVSTAPQTLPAWNIGAAGIKAFYFRDPEDHVLEVIYFPPGKGNPKWQQPTDKIFLGIDHTAIVVSDTDRSLAFYRDVLGLRVAGESENYGVEQEHLNQTFGARLHITGLRATTGPGIEFLEYIAPPGGRSLPPDAAVNDLIAWRVELTTDDAVGLATAAKWAGGSLVSTATASNPSGVWVRDPDGHLVVFKN